MASQRTILLLLMSFVVILQVLPRLVAGNPLEEDDQGTPLEEDDQGNPVGEDYLGTPIGADDQDVANEDINESPDIKEKDLSENAYKVNMKFCEIVNGEPQKCHLIERSE